MNVVTKPVFATLEKALSEFNSNGKVGEARCERCASIIEVARKTETVLTVKCACGLYNDTLRGL